MRFHRRCAVMLLHISILSSQTSTYPLVVNVTTIGGSYRILGLGQASGDTFDKGFVNCVCKRRPSSPCYMDSAEVIDSLSPWRDALTAEHAASYSTWLLFQCQYNQYEDDDQRKVSCMKVEEASCAPSTCTINIISNCNSGKNIVLSWNSIQQPVVLGSPAVTVIDCCKSSTTTTEVTTISTTLTPTTFIFTSTQPTFHLTSTTSVDSSTITSLEIVQSTSPTPDIITTNSTPSDTANQQQGTSDTSSLTSGQLIGIIVGTAVAAILITILIICIFWKLKSRREKNRRNEQTDSTMPVSGSVGETQGNDVRQHVNEGTNKTLKAIAHVSPLVQSRERESHLTETPGDYIYIDIKSAASSKSSTAITSSSPIVEEYHQHPTPAEVVPEMQDSEYSHLGASKVRQENPYNCLDHQSRSTITEPVIIPVLQIDNHQHNRYVDMSYVHIRPANHHISHDTEQANGANENISLYSHLGESKAQQENTYNSLPSINVQAITEPCFTQHSCTTNGNSEIMAEHTPSPNHKLDSFTHTSKHKSMDIVDVAPSTYTAIIPTTKGEKSNDSSQLKDTSNHTKATASSSDQPMPQESTSLKTLTEINMTQGTVHDVKKHSEREDEPGQTYANTVYSMHECPQEDNTTFSLDASEYANMS